MLAMVGFVNWSTSWICGHSVFLAAVSHHGVSECQPHSHGPFEHSHENEGDQDHKEDKVGVRLLATASVPHSAGITPVHLYKVFNIEEHHGVAACNSCAIAPRARSSPPKPVSGRALLLTIERWLA